MAQLQRLHQKHGHSDGLIARPPGGLEPGVSMISLVAVASCTNSCSQWPPNCSKPPRCIPFPVQPLRAILPLVTMLQPKYFAFVLMPSIRAFDDVYKFGITGGVASVRKIGLSISEPSRRDRDSTPIVTLRGEGTVPMNGIDGFEEATAAISFVNSFVGGRSKPIMPTT